MKKAIKNSILFKELDKDIAYNLFNCTEKKFIHNIDNLYYTIKIKDDCTDNKLIDDIIKSLRKLKNRIRVDVCPEYKGLIVKNGTYGNVYKYRLSEPDKYDIYIADYLPNEYTPRICVQLRSHCIWLEGIRKMIVESYTKVEEIFHQTKVIFEDIKENRIDYAYHTNYISNPKKYFSDNNLIKHLKSNLTLYQKVGRVKDNTLSAIDITIDYLSLGKRKSNNVFFRTYNKTREVVEQGYKGFFFKLWYDAKLISKYDRYCLEQAYEKRNYKYIHKARLEFYLQYSSDIINKKEVQKILDSPKTTYLDCEIMANKLTPAVTEVINIEYETKRKFYCYSDKFIDTFEFKPVSVFCFNGYTGILNRLFKIIDNRNIFLDYLTSETVAFVIDNKCKKEDIKYQDFWLRLRGLKMLDIIGDSSEYERVYNNLLDIDVMKSRAINSVASNSVYQENVESSFTEDLSSLLSLINDNTSEDYSIRIVNEYGEIVNDDINMQINDKYKKYKKKKYRQIKNKLPQQQNLRSCDNPELNSIISNSTNDVNDNTIYEQDELVYCEGRKLK